MQRRRFTSLHFGKKTLADGTVVLFTEVKVQKKNPLHGDLVHYILLCSSSTVPLCEHAEASLTAPSRPTVILTSTVGPCQVTFDRHGAPIVVEDFGG